jgi:pimeloyl-ACP methyl ester carboxylesterase
MVTLGLVATERITTPLLVLGEEDATYPPSDVRKTTRAYGTQAALIPEIGHSMTVEPGWETVAGHIASWLTERGL